MNEEQYNKIQNASRKNWQARAYLDSRFGTSRNGWNRWVFEQIAFPPCAKILELGCGSAELWTRNADRLPNNAVVILSDLSQKTLAHTKQALGPKAWRFEFFVVDAEQTPFADALFDIVIANRMLYFTNLNQSLPEISRVLKPGGRLYAATVGRENMQEIIELYFNFFCAQDRTRRTVADIFGLDNGCDVLKRFFSKAEVRRFANELLVTESEPLVEYMRTAQSIDSSHLTPAGIKKFRDYLNSLIRKQGCIRITKDAGLLVGEK